jgi:hypothetical protein
MSNRGLKDPNRLKGGEEGEHGEAGTPAPALFPEQPPLYSDPREPGYRDSVLDLAASDFLLGC